MFYNNPQTAPDQKSEAVFTTYALKNNPITAQFKTFPVLNTEQPCCYAAHTPNEPFSSRKPSLYYAECGRL